MATKTAPRMNRYRMAEREEVQRIDEYEIDTVAPTPPPNTPFIPIDANGPFAKQPPVPTWDRRTADPTSEYVGAEPIPFLANYVRALPPYIDDISRDFGSDIYERMLNDAIVYKNLHSLKMSTLSDGLSIMPIIEDKDDPNYQKAKDYSDFCDRAIKALPTDIHMTLYQMMDGFALGNKVSEKTFRIAEDGEDEGKMVLKCLKVKERASVAFVVDVFFNVIGLMGIVPGQGFPVLIGTVAGNPDFIPNLLPREKFMVLTCNPRNEDPRGTSVFRSAYDPWYLKQQTKPEYLRYLGKFAVPSLIGTTPENATAQPATDGLGNPIYAPNGFVPGQSNPVYITPEKQMALALSNIRNGYAAAFPFGSTVTPLTAGSGAPFTEALQYFDQQITEAILMQTLAVMEGEHQARAAADTHKDIFDIAVLHFRRIVTGMLRRELLYYLIYYNFGKDEADNFTPKAVLGEIAVEDFGPTAMAINALFSSGYLSPSQVPGCDERLHLPVRKEEGTEQGNHVPASPLIQGQVAQANASAQATLNPPAKPEPGKAKKGGTSGASGSSEEVQGSGRGLNSNFARDTSKEPRDKGGKWTAEQVEVVKKYIEQSKAPGSHVTTNAQMEFKAGDHYFNSPEAKKHFKSHKHFQKAVAEHLQANPAFDAFVAANTDAYFDNLVWEHYRRRLSNDALFTSTVGPARRRRRKKKRAASLG